ncbi:MAG TPA: hypothetical protein VHS99_04570 [Chloroflexota bacterium]|nr:hypothetical protein [Chloroflexota bacterium]
MSDDTDEAMPQHPNYVRTARKQVCLTAEGRALIQEWADREGVSFSAAIETLARLGLREDPRDAWGPALTSKVVRAVRADLGRIVGVFAATAIDAGMAARLAGAAVRHHRPREYHRIKQLARLETVSLLRRRDALSELGLVEPDEASTGHAAHNGHTGHPPPDA